MHGNVVPIRMPSGEKTDADGKKLHYKGASFHRIVPGFVRGSFLIPLDSFLIVCCSRPCFVQ